MAGKPRLTRTQREMLRLIASGPVVDIKDETVVRSLEKKEFVYWTGYGAKRVWRIWPAGRSALNQPGGSDG